MQSARVVPPTRSLERVGRSLVAEGLGSLLLAAAVVGSGIMGEQLAGGNLAIALIANTMATVAALATLIAMMWQFSGAHFNPVISLMELTAGVYVAANHATSPCSSPDVVPAQYWLRDV